MTFRKKYTMTDVSAIRPTPTATGSLGHAGCGAPERTRSRVGVKEREFVSDKEERCERFERYTLHDAMVEYGLPVPLHAIYRANTISLDEQKVLLSLPERTATEPDVVAPAFIERMASTPEARLTQPCRQWATKASEGDPGWVWIRSSSVEQAMATALLMVKNTGRSGMVGRLNGLASLCRRTPLYGPGSRDDIIHEWASQHVLAIAVSAKDHLAVVTLEIFLMLLQQRKDSLQPTIFCSDATGASIFSGAGRPHEEAILCRDAALLITQGLSGFPSDGKDEPFVIDMSSQSEGK